MSHIFLITHQKFYGRNVFPWEDSIENVTSYGNHNKAYTFTKLLRTSKWFDWFNGSQLAKLKKSIPDMSLPWNL